MGGMVGNFLFGIFAIAIIAELVKPGSQTGTVINDSSNLLSNSIKAAKS